eukprot:5826326-Pleurochrysis_carterae.AAC.8
MREKAELRLCASLDACFYTRPESRACACANARANARADNCRLGVASRAASASSLRLRKACTVASPSSQLGAHRCTHPRNNKGSEISLNRVVTDSASQFASLVHSASAWLRRTLRVLTSRLIFIHNARAPDRLLRCRRTPASVFVFRKFNLPHSFWPRLSSAHSGLDADVGTCERASACPSQSIPGQRLLRARARVQAKERVRFMTPAGAPGSPKLSTLVP